MLEGGASFPPFGGLFIFNLSTSRPLRSIDCGSGKCCVFFGSKKIGFKAGFWVRFEVFIGRFYYGSKKQVFLPVDIRCKK